MKIILTTVYEGVDEKWIEWYLSRLESSKEPYQILSARALRRGNEYYSFTSTNPDDSRVSATTTYRIEK